MLMFSYRRVKGWQYETVRSQLKFDVNMPPYNWERQYTRTYMWKATLSDGGYNLKKNTLL